MGLLSFNFLIKYQITLYLSDRDILYSYKIS